VEELEEKAQTVLVGRTSIPGSAKGRSVTCEVDGCLSQALVTCEVKVINQHLNPDNETHGVKLCQTHDKGFQSLKWQWRRMYDAGSARLQLDGVYAPDAVEDM
jgi:hypothetical protein